MTLGHCDEFFASLAEDQTGIPHVAEVNNIPVGLFDKTIKYRLKAS